MTYNPIFLTALTLSEKAALSVEMLLSGMGTVFLVLIILWGIIAAIGMVFSSGSKKTEVKKDATAAKKSEPTQTPVSAPVVQPAPAPSAPSASSDDALIAAICAAIEAYRAEEGLSGLPYRVVSFKRRSGKKSWTGNSED